MDEKLRIKLANRYKVGGGSQNAPRHPEAKPQGQFMCHRREAHILKGIPMKKKFAPTTPADVRMAYRGLVNFMEFFGGDRKLAARSCGVGLATINKAIRNGFLTPYVALAAQKIPEMPWLPGGLCPHIKYEEDWDEMRAMFDRWVAQAERARAHTLKYGWSKTGNPNAPGRQAGVVYDPGTPPAWATRDDILG